MEERKKVSVMVDSSRESRDDAPFDFKGFQDGFYEEPSGPYQTRKTSIVNGMSTDRLIDEHRKSIAQLAQDGDGGSEVDLGALSGVTLSRRHTLSQAEYKDGMEPESYERMQSFEFGESSP